MVRCVCVYGCGFMIEDPEAEVLEYLCNMDLLGRLERNTCMFSIYPTTRRLGPSHNFEFGAADVLLHYDSEGLADPEILGCYPMNY